MALVTTTEILAVGSGALLGISLEWFAASDGDAPGRLSRLEATGVVVLAAAFLAAWRGLTLHAGLDVWVAAAAALAAVGFALVTNDGAAWVVNLLAADAAVLFGFGMALVFGTVGWFTLATVLRFPVGPGQVVGAVVMALAVLDARGVVDMEVL